MSRPGSNFGAKPVVLGPVLADSITLDEELDLALSDGNLFVGSAAGKATGKALSGDATLANTGVLTMANTAVTPGSYTTADITVDSKGRLTAASNAALPDGQLLVGNGAGAAAAVALSGDATLANTGALTLANTAVTPGSYTTADITVAADGRVTAAASADLSSLPTQDITRIDDSATGNIFAAGTGAINVGTSGSGTVTIGPSPDPIEITTVRTTAKGNLLTQGNFSRRYSLVTLTTAGNASHSSSTWAGGFVLRDCNGAARTDTSPTAAALVSTLGTAVLGSAIEVQFTNTSTGIDELLLINPGTGITMDRDLYVGPGQTIKVLVYITSVTGGSEAATVYTTTSREQIILQGTINNFTEASTKYANWGHLSLVSVDGSLLGKSGTITQMTINYANSTHLSIGAGESVSFSIGTASVDSKSFTVASGGADLIVWTDTGASVTYPAESTGRLAIRFSSSDKLAVRSVEVGTVTSTATDIRVTLVIELD